MMFRTVYCGRNAKNEKDKSKKNPFRLQYMYCFNRKIQARLQSLTYESLRLHAPTSIESFDSK
jgi:hypothetical protein